MRPESAQSERGDGSSSSAEPDSKVVSDVPQSVPVQQSQRKPEEITLADDSDSSDEVDICDAPLPATPKKVTPVTGSHSSPARSDFSPGVSSPAVEKSPVLRLKTPLKPAASPGPSSFVGMFSRSESKSSGPVPCHYCPPAVCQSAVKTCLVCGASMCPEHLRPHLESPVFQNHTLVPPVEDISPWRCQEHQEINRIFCRQCGVCVCTVCTVIGSHRDHVCISIREAEKELRVSVGLYWL